MSRLFQILVSLLAVTLVFSGCFGGDDDGGSDPTASPSPTPSPTANNTTDPFAGAKVPPVASMAMTLEADGEVVAGPSHLVSNDAWVNVTFDASNSTDEDGEIVAYSWEIQSAGGFNGRSTNATFTADFGKMTGAKFGVHRVILKVLDSDNIMTQLVEYFAIDYQNVYTLPGGMVGPGTEARNDANERKVSTINNVNTGTFEWRQATLGENATSIDVTLEYQTQTSATMKLFLFDPSVGTDETGTGTPAAESGSVASPVTLTHTGNLTAGPWKLRTELDGVSITGFTMTVVVTYALPADEPAAPAPDADDGTA